MPGLGVIMRILVGGGSTIGALALTESQAHVKSLFAVIAKTKTKVLLSAGLYDIFHLLCNPFELLACLLHGR